MGDFNMPPGVSVMDIPGNGREVCECCGAIDPAPCACPVCPQCGQYGAEKCYRDHGLMYSHAQVEGIKKLLSSRQKEATTEIVGCSSYHIIIKRYDRENIIRVVKAIRYLTDVGLKMARDIAMATPYKLQHRLSGITALQWKKELEDAGATVEVIDASPE